MQSPLTTELAAYDRMRASLEAAHEGKFAVLVDEELVGVFDTAEKAYEAGIESKGNVPMLIRRVGEESRSFFAPALHLGLTHGRPQ